MMKLIKNILLKFYRYLVQLDRNERLNTLLKTHKLKLGHDVVLKINTSILIGNIEIGDNTYINDYARIVSGANSHVKIGNNCAVGRFFGCASITHNLKRPTRDKEFDHHLQVENNIIIGSSVWIGDRVTIKEGVVIGDFAVIGANSVVTKDVKSFEIVAGSPATHIRFNKEHYSFKK